MRAKPFLTLLLALALALTACGPKPTEAPTAVPSETPTPTPTLPPTPDTPLAILLIPADMDQATSDLYQKTVYDLAQGSGFRFQVRNTLSPVDAADPTLKVVIALPPDPGIAALAAAAPQARFLTVNMPEVTASANVSTLSNSVNPDMAAFLAGYISAMLTDDYKIGMILPKDDPVAQRAALAFKNGKTYFCGLCQTVYLQNISYPQFVEIPADADKATYTAYADILIITNRVGMIYTYPSVTTDGLLNYIGTTGVWSIADNMPGQRPAGFVTAMQPDAISAIQAAWPSLVAGAQGTNILPPLGLLGVDPGLLPEGKQRDVENILRELIAGRIDPIGPQ